MARPPPHVACPDCNGDPPCSDCGRCIHNQFLESELEKWFQNLKIHEGRKIEAQDPEIERLDRLIESRGREIERLHRQWTHLVTDFAKKVPCEIDKEELAEIAKRPCSMESGKQLLEILKKHFPEWRNAGGFMES
ncbi:uncharacterized protein [Solanum lycopersicum]|uniref:Uncharacterized protein n=1 Tax=Solanum lycopersicum TaxID=4081 RepID=A0A3Q7IT27_SOLLC|nr:uncharacterized protein LOC104644489 [Solanum lycopersicum]